MTDPDLRRNWSLERARAHLRYLLTECVTYRPDPPQQPLDRVRG